MIDLTKYDNTLDGVSKARRDLALPPGVPPELINSLLNNLQNFLDATREEQSLLEPGLEKAYVKMLNGIATGLDELDTKQGSFNPQSQASIFLSQVKDYVYACIQDNLVSQPESLCAIWFNSLENNLKTKLAEHTGSTVKGLN